MSRSGTVSAAASLPRTNLDDLAKKLLAANRAACWGLVVSILLTIVPIALFVPGGASSLFGMLCVLLVLLVAPFGLAGLVKPSELWREVAVLKSLSGLEAAHASGLNLAARVRAPDVSVAPLHITIRALGSGSRFVMELPWDPVGDIMVAEAFLYSDFPALVEDLRRVHLSLAPREHVWSNIVDRTLESVVRPRWGKGHEGSETAESVRDRILGRWRDMDRLRRQAAAERRLLPTLTMGEGSVPPGPFYLAGWCPACRRGVPATAREMPKSCRRCGGATLRVAYRSTETISLNWKMERIHARYGF